MDGYDAPQPDTSSSEQVTSLSEEAEDRLRKFLFDLFDMSDNELLCLKHIMNGDSLVEFANNMQKTSVKNAQFSRYRAF